MTQIEIPKVVVNSIYSAGLDAKITIPKIVVNVVYVPAPPPLFDEHWANVVYLNHFEGNDAATVSPDSSISQHAVTFVADAQLATTDPLMETSSLLLDGTGDYVSSLDSADWHFDGEFTLETRFVFDDLNPSSQAIISQYNSGTNQRSWLIDRSGNSLRFWYATIGSSGTSIVVAFTPIVGDVYSVAVDRDSSGVIRVYLNGKMGNKNTQASPLFASNERMIIGDKGDLTQTFKGKIDEVRITKGVARYATDSGYVVHDLPFLHSGDSDPTTITQGVDSCSLTIESSTEPYCAGLLNAYKVNDSAAYLISFEARVEDANGDTGNTTSGFSAIHSQMSADLGPDERFVSPLNAIEPGSIDTVIGVTANNIIGVNDVGLTTSYQYFAFLFYPDSGSLWGGMSFINGEGLGLRKLSITNVSITKSDGAALDISFPYMTFFTSGDVSVTNGNTIKKVSGTGDWNASAFTQESFIGAAGLLFKFDNNTSALAVGLNDAPSASGGYIDIDFAWVSSATGFVSVYENGVEKTTKQLFSVSDIFAIIYDGVFVKYYINQILQYTSLSSPSSTSPWFFDSSFFTVGGQISSVAFNQSSVTDYADTRISNNSIVFPNLTFIVDPTIIPAANGLTKDSGLAAWDAQAYTQEFHIGGAQISFKVGNATSDLAVGITSDPAIDSDYDTIDYAIKFNTAGNAQVVENGALKGATWAYTNTMLFTITYNGAEVKYFADGVLKYTSLTTPGPTVPLYFDSSFFTVGASINTITFTTTSVMGIAINGLYFNTDGVNPATVLGYGTWEAFAPGRTLVGVGQGTDENSTSRTITAGETDGVYTHTQIEGEVGEHKHAGVMDEHGDNTGNLPERGGDANQSGVYNTNINQAQAAVTAMDWMMPFEGVYFWKRTA